MRVATPQQQAVYDAVRATASHVNVESVAGSGKSTTAVGCAYSVPSGTKVGFVAFNKHIATELQAKLGGRASACTLHSLGFTAVRKAFPGVEVDEQKPRRLLERMRPRWASQGRSGRLVWDDRGQAALSLAGLCKKTLADPTLGELLRLANYYGVELPPGDGVRDDIRDAVAELLDAAASQTAVIDYDDMLWLPVKLGLTPEHYAVLLVDEAQDLSRCQQELARRAGDRIVVLGDRAQSIYGFSGADPESLPTLVGELGAQPAGCLDRPLTVTFRCPSSHVALARQIVPQIEAVPGAREGTVASVRAGDLPGLIVPGDLVVCRKNAPLVSLAFKLIRRGVPAIMLGRDFAKGLVDLCGRMKADSPVDLIAKLRNHLAREIERLDRRDAPESQIQGVQDRVACLVDLASTAASIGELNGHIGRLFSDTADKAAVVTLASIHRAKGSEAERVFVLEPECLPMVGRKTKAWEHRQELNLVYVALTRAKESLTFAGPVPACLGGPPRQVRDPRPEAVVTL